MLGGPTLSPYFRTPAPTSSSKSISRHLGPDSGDPSASSRDLQPFVHRSNTKIKFNQSNRSNSHTKTLNSGMDLSEVLRDASRKNSRTPLGPLSEAVAFSDLSKISSRKKFGSLFDLDGHHGSNQPTAEKIRGDASVENTRFHTPVRSQRVIGSRAGEIWVDLPSEDLQLMLREEELLVKKIAQAEALNAFIRKSKGGAPGPRPPSHQSGVQADIRKQLEQTHRKVVHSEKTKLLSMKGELNQLGLKAGYLKKTVEKLEAKHNELLQALRSIQQKEAVLRLSQQQYKTVEATHRLLREGDKRVRERGSDLLFRLQQELEQQGKLDLQKGVAKMILAEKMHEIPNLDRLEKEIAAYEALLESKTRKEAI